ncbi:MAG: hypothetical protein LBJ00_10420 [Planctomycetaceae bacterium]|nr:hypothetical protein [Planctomycetaceae bacterium]
MFHECTPKNICVLLVLKARYTQATLKFTELNTQAQQREAVVQGRSLSPYWLQYMFIQWVGSVLGQHFDRRG